MPNPIIQNSQMANVKSLIRMVRGASNPAAYMQQIAMNNPQVKQMIDFARQYGSPQKAFYAMAEQKGVNADEFMRELFN